MGTASTELHQCENSFFLYEWSNGKGIFAAKKSSTESGSDIEMQYVLGAQAGRHLFARTCSVFQVSGKICSGGHLLQTEHGGDGVHRTKRKYGRMVCFFLLIFFPMYAKRCVSFDFFVTTKELCRILNIWMGSNARFRPCGRGMHFFF